MKLKLKLKWVSWCWTSWSFNAKFFMRYNCSFDKVVVFPFLLVLILCSWTYFNYDTATEFSNFPCVLIIWSLSLSVCARACAQHKRMCACVCMLACLHMLVIFFCPNFCIEMQCLILLFAFTCIICTGSSHVIWDLSWRFSKDRLDLLGSDPWSGSYFCVSTCTQAFAWVVGTSKLWDKWFLINNEFHGFWVLGDCYWYKSPSCFYK